MKNKPWLPYVAPMALYMTFLLVQAPKNMVWIYPAKIITVAAALWLFRTEYVELRAKFSGLLLPVGIGLAAIIIWIAIDPFYPGLSKITTGEAPRVFDPHTLSTPVAFWGFIGVRVFGAVVIVPIMEELFWRAFMIRWLVAEDFQQVPVGTYTGKAFVIVAALFALEHDQWLAGLICGGLYNWLYGQRRDIFTCVIAHAVSNAALAAWVLLKGDWKFW